MCVLAKNLGKWRILLIIMEKNEEKLDRLLKYIGIVDRSNINMEKNYSSAPEGISAEKYFYRVYSVSFFPLLFPITYHSRCKARA